MTIYSIGHDIVKNSRIKTLLDTHGEQFILKVLSTSEQEVLPTKKDRVGFIAKRFAGKEAFAKACGIGVRDPILLPNISIMNDDLGRPYLVLDDKVKQWLSTHGISNYHISISDEDDLASAIVVLEK